MMPKIIMRYRKNQKGDHVAHTIATYNRIAPDYQLTATPEMRSWEENSMRIFAGYLTGNRVLVPGCGDGRDSRFLANLGLSVTPFDLSEGMLAIASIRDLAGRYRLLDLRKMDKCGGPYDGVFASGCLYHLTKAEFAQWLRVCRTLLSETGVLYLNLSKAKENGLNSAPVRSIREARKPEGACPGSASMLIINVRNYRRCSAVLLILREQMLMPGDGGFEFWLRKCIKCSSSHQEPM